VPWQYLEEAGLPHAATAITVPAASTALLAAFNFGTAVGSLKIRAHRPDRRGHPAVGDPQLRLRPLARPPLRPVDRTG
jgi:hypothetical protein